MEKDTHSPLKGEFHLSDTKSHSTTSGKKKTTEVEDLDITTPHSPHFYSSLVARPKGVHYQYQEEDEEIILLIRRGFITNLTWILGAFVMVLVPFFLPSLLSVFPFFNPSSTTTTAFLLFYYLIVSGFILLNFTLWYFHVGLITNKRAIDVDLNGILVRDIAETKLNLIEDVSYKQVGGLHAIFGLGSVSIQTAGPHVNVEFDRIPQPARVARIITNLII